MVDYVQITPEYVECLDRPSEAFLCPMTANTYTIDFTAFKIRAVEDAGETTICEVRKDPGAGPVQPEALDDSARFIQYQFGPALLDYSTIGTTLEFTVGDQPLHNFRMIERHYFRDILIKSYDYTLPFVIPNTTNTWEVIYNMPELDPALKEAIVAFPWETKSDSFYFVDDQLVMHNKAEYSYS